MAKYDVFPNLSGDGYLLDVQTDLLSDLNTRDTVTTAVDMLMQGF